jgi:tetratricopeptide (TPR) repeat protein
VADCTKPWKTACDAARAEARPRRIVVPRSARGLCNPSLILLFLLLTKLQFPAPAAAAQHDDALQSRISADVYEYKALDNFYSAEFREAEEQYKKALAIEPENPLYWNGLADSRLFQLLMAAGRLDSRFYSAANDFLDVKPAPPDAAKLQSMWDALASARRLAEQRIAANSKDAVAYYALAVNYSIEAHYHLNLERKPLDALHDAGTARDAALHARQLDPQNSDINLILGGYEYAIGSVPAAFRWLLALGGHSGSKARGVELIQDAMLHGKRASTAALALLAVAYGREKMYVYSREMFQHLARFFPRNYLYEMEIARTYQREGNLVAAIEVSKNIARKYEAGAAGYERVGAAKLYFQIAMLLEEHKRPDAAAEFFQKVTSQKPEGLLQGQSYLRLGEYYRARNEREKARAMYEDARRLPFLEIQKQAAAALKKL